MVKSYVIGRGKCPKCGAEGTVILRLINSKPYVYVRHGKRWHYIGKLDEVNIELIIMNSAASRPKLTRNEGAGPGRRVAVPILITAILTAVTLMIITTGYYNTQNLNINNQEPTTYLTPPHENPHPPYPIHNYTITEHHALEELEVEYD